MNLAAFAAHADVDPAVLDWLDFTDNWETLVPTLSRMERALHWKPGTFAKMWESREHGVEAKDAALPSSSPSAEELFCGLFRSPPQS